MIYIPYIVGFLFMILVVILFAFSSWRTLLSRDSFGVDGKSSSLAEMLLAVVNFIVLFICAFFVYQKVSSLSVDGDVSSYFSVHIILIAYILFFSIFYPCFYAFAYKILGGRRMSSLLVVCGDVGFAIATAIFMYVKTFGGMGA